MRPKIQTIFNNSWLLLKKRKPKKELRDIRGLLKDLFYSVKAEIFDVEEQMLVATEIK